MISNFHPMFRSSTTLNIMPHTSIFIFEKGASTPGPAVLTNGLPLISLKLLKHLIKIFAI